MAERGHPRQAGDGDQEFTFTNVQLFKNETLGTGSYGAVCKAKCDQLMCAAKLIWPALLQMAAPDPGKEHRQPFQRFESECRVLSRINHPNVVQYLGTYRDPETNAAVLLMELMDESLTHYLESSAGDIPHHIEVNLASDIAQALVFLHANGIIHRDLSSNNVLLLAGRAKVTDFGMLKVTPLNATRLATMTTCPGTPAFMSPEALNEPPVYTEKLDNFSFGVLLVQIVTRQFPKPSNRFRVLQIPDPQNPTRTLEVKADIPEVDRRQAHISLIEPTQPLLPVALECLKDRDAERPSSQQLCQSMDALKRTARYEESSQQDVRQLLRAKDEELQTHQEQIRAKDEELQAKGTENRRLTERLDQSTQDIRVLQHEKVTLRENNQALRSDAEAKERQLRRLNQQLESNEEITAALQQTITQRDREVSELRGMLTSKNEKIQAQAQSNRSHQVALQEQQATASTRRRISMVWESLRDAPVGITAGSSAVIGDKAYFRPDGSQTIHEFNSITNKWAPLPKVTLKDFTIVNVDSMLTTVGGRSVLNLSTRKWVDHFPPMPTRRNTPAAVYVNNTLVVAGGSVDYLTDLTTVEILNTRNKRWSSVSSLPFQTDQPSTTICGDYIYLHTGIGSPPDEENSVLKCSLSALVQSKPSSAVWERIAKLPCYRSSLATINSHLLAVGGRSHKDKQTEDIYQYNPTTNSWQVVGQMSAARSQSLTASLPHNKLIVVGGYYARVRMSVEMATINWCLI